MLDIRNDGLRLKLLVVVAAFGRAGEEDRNGDGAKRRIGETLGKVVRWAFVKRTGFLEDKWKVLR